jgi:hypothetical protein
MKHIGFPRARSCVYRKSLRWKETFSRQGVRSVFLFNPYLQPYSFVKSLIASCLISYFASCLIASCLCKHTATTCIPFLGQVPHAGYCDDPTDTFGDNSKELRDNSRDFLARMLNILHAGVRSVRHTFSRTSRSRELLIPQIHLASIPKGFAIIPETSWRGCLMEWSGVEWSGVQWSGVECSGVECSGVE